MVRNRKEATEGNLNDADLSLNVFTGGLQSPECLHILLNFMKNMRLR